MYDDNLALWTSMCMSKTETGFLGWNRHESWHMLLNNWNNKLFYHRQLFQKKGFSLVWTLKWTLKVDVCAKHFPQTGYSYGFTPVWILAFKNIWSWLTNSPSEKVHLNGFLPVWDLSTCWISSLCTCCKNGRLYRLFWHLQNIWNHLCCQSQSGHHNFSVS